MVHNLQDHQATGIPYSYFCCIIIIVIIIIIMVIADNMQDV